MSKNKARTKDEEAMAATEEGEETITEPETETEVETEETKGEPERPEPEPAPSPAVVTDKTPKRVIIAFNSPQGVVFRLFRNGAEYRRVEIHGNADALRGARKGVVPVGKFGYTEIDAEDWAEIKRQYGDMAVFKNGLIFSQGSVRSAEDEAKDRAETRNGFEPADPAEMTTEPGTAQS